MSDNFTNLDWVDGQVSVPGIYPKLWYVPKSQISAWPQFTSAPSSAEEEVKLIGNFALTDANVFKLINCIDVKSEPSSEQQGETRCKSYLNKLKVVVSLTDKQATALAKLAANSDLIWIFQERDTGEYRVCGSERFNTTTKVGLNIGGSPTSEKGTTLEVEASDICPFPFYDGLLTDSTGEINAAAV